MAKAEARAREDSPAPPVAERAVNLGARLREVRLKAGLSLRAVARELGVSPSFVSQLENDRSRPSVGTLYSLAQLLDVSMDQLFESAETRSGPSSNTPAEAPAVPANAAPISRSDSFAFVSENTSSPSMADETVMELMSVPRLWPRIRTAFTSSCFFGSIGVLQKLPLKPSSP